jgi:hypothetical protein
VLGGGLRQHAGDANQFLKFVRHSAGMRKLILATTLATLVLAGCASPAPEDRPVATLKSAAPSIAASKAPERPVYPIDNDPEVSNRIGLPYWKCLKAQGVPMDSVTADGLGKPTVDRNDPEHRAGFDKCANLEPEFWIDREARTNPEYADYLRVAVKCLTAKGYKAYLRTDPVEIGYSNRGEEVRAIDDRDRCLLEAFAGRLKLYGAK